MTAFLPSKTFTHCYTQSVKKRRLAHHTQLELMRLSVSISLQLQRGKASEHICQQRQRKLAHHIQLELMRLSVSISLQLRRGKKQANKHLSTKAETCTSHSI